MKLLRMRLLTSGVLRHTASPGARALALALGLSGFAAFSLAQEPVKPKAVEAQLKSGTAEATKVIDEAPMTPEEKAAAELDAKIIEDETKNSEIMANLQYISDVIGPRLTGSANLKRANEYTAEKMKSYGLENVHLEPWSIPVGWERGTATIRMIEPDNSKYLSVAAAGWSPGTKGKVIGDVVVVTATTPKELEAYKGKLKNAIVLRSPPATVGPIAGAESGPNPYIQGGGGGGRRRGGQGGAGGAPPAGGAAGATPPAGGAAGAPPRPVPATNPPATGQVLGGQPPANTPPPAGTPGAPPVVPQGRRGGFGRGGPLQAEIAELLRSEGVACTLSDSGKPQGLLNMSGGWPRGGNDRQAREPIPQLYVSHDHYAMLYRLATRKDAKTRAEVEITNKFIPGPIAVYNTVGEIKGSEKPDEFVVVGAHLDSWDLGTGTTDNGTGSSVVLECARLLGKCGVKPKRTIRFVLFTGEEEGLHGSREYVTLHAKEMAKTSMALVHDTGTGKVTAIGTQSLENCLPILKKELAGLKKLGVEINTRGVNGSDHQSFDRVGVPGFAFQQAVAEYRLTHHSQSDTFDKARPDDLKQGAEVMAIAAMRVANLPKLLPRDE
jgi:carboxypeptidase Q